MHIVEENAEGFLRAFHGQQSEMIVAMLVLTVRRQDLALFSSLLEGVAEVDQALGKEIGLFLFHPGQSPGLTDGGRVLAGERIESGLMISPQTRANTFYKSARDQWAGEHVAKIVAQSSANIVQDFCAALDVDSGDLPCVYTLIKGVPGGIVSRAGDRLSYEAIVRAAHVLRPQAELARQRWDGLVSDIPDMERAIAELERFASREQKLRKKVLELAASLERRYNIVLRPQLEVMLARRSLTPAQVDTLIGEVAGDETDAVLANSRTQGIRASAIAIADIAGKAHDVACANDEARLVNYSTMIEEIQLQLAHAARSAFAEAGVTVWRYSDHGGAFSKAGQMIGMAARVVSLIRRAIIPTP